MSWTNQEKPIIKVEFLATESLNFLMTEADEYLVTNDSLFWTNITK